MQKPLNTQKPNNYAGAESSKFVAVGIINLEGETGHEIADLCVKDLLENFNGNDWGMDFKNLTYIHLRIKLYFLTTQEIMVPAF